MSMQLRKTILVLVVVLPACATLRNCAFATNNHATQPMNSESYFSRPTSQAIVVLLNARENPFIHGSFPAGADVNEVGKAGITPLIYAVIYLNQSAVNHLIDLGANPNMRQDDGHNAFTAAYEVCGRAPGIIETIMKSDKCNLNASMPDGEPVLFYLAAGGKTNLLRVALANGANPSLKTRGRRPLVIAVALQEQYEAVNMLLDAGADPNARDLAGETLTQVIESGASQQIDPDGKVNQDRLRLLARLNIR